MNNYSVSYAVSWIMREYRDGRIGETDRDTLLEFVATYSIYEAMVCREIGNQIAFGNGIAAQETAHAAVLAGILEDLEAKKRRVV